MPELPEVETIVRCLRPRLRGRTIVDAKAGAKRMRQRWNRKWRLELQGAQIADVRRRGKWIIVDLDKERRLLFHLGMTGQLRVLPGDQPVEAHTHFVFPLTPGGDELRFRDVRRFGCASLFSADALEMFFERSKLGPEPFAWAGDAFYERLKDTRRCLKAVLLDQRVVAGVGNIYADEALFEAGMRPTRIGRRLARTDADRLRRAVVAVLRRAIARKGSSVRDYVDGDGEPGGYQREFRVYQQTGRPCRRCGEPIRQIRLAGRSTHFCGRCQK